MSPQSRLPATRSLSSLGQGGNSRASIYEPLKLVDRARSASPQGLNDQWLVHARHQATAADGAARAAADAAALAAATAALAEVKSDIFADFLKSHGGRNNVKAVKASPSVPSGTRQSPRSRQSPQSLSAMRSQSAAVLSPRLTQSPQSHSAVRSRSAAALRHSPSATSASATSSRSSPGLHGTWSQSPSGTSWHPHSPQSNRTNAAHDRPWTKKNGPTGKDAQQKSSDKQGAQRKKEIATWWENEAQRMTGVISKLKTTSEQLAQELEQEKKSIRHWQYELGVAQAALARQNEQADSVFDKQSRLRTEVNSLRNEKEKKWLESDKKNGEVDRLSDEVQTLFDQIAELKGKRREQERRRVRPSAASEAKRKRPSVVSFASSQISFASKDTDGGQQISSQTTSPAMSKASTADFGRKLSESSQINQESVARTDTDGQQVATRTTPAAVRQSPSAEFGLMYSDLRGSVSENTPTAAADTDTQQVATRMKPFAIRQSSSSDFEERLSALREGAEEIPEVKDATLAHNARAQGQAGAEAAGIGKAAVGAIETEEADRTAANQGALTKKAIFLAVGSASPWSRSERYASNSSARSNSITVASPSPTSARTSSVRLTSPARPRSARTSSRSKLRE